MRLGLCYKNNAFLLRLDFTWRLFRAKRTICIQIQETKKYVFRNISNVSNLVAGACLLGFPAGLSRPGKSREGPGTGRDRTGPRDLEGPVVLAGQDLETLKVPGLF